LHAQNISLYGKNCYSIIFLQSKQYYDNDFLQPQNFGIGMPTILGFGIGQNGVIENASTENVQGGPKKWHKVYGIIILQPYITKSCSFQQSVLKEILYMTKVSV